MLTGMGFVEDLLQEAQEKGADGYVSKVLPLDELLELMLIAHPQHHAMIKQKFAAAAGSPTPEASNSDRGRDAAPPESAHSLSGRDAAPPGSAHSLSVPQGGRQL